MKIDKSAEAKRISSQIHVVDSVIDRTVYHGTNFAPDIVNEIVNNVTQMLTATIMMTLHLLRNACTTSEVSITKIQSNLTYDVAIESSTNIATVGGKQKQVKQYRRYNT